MNEKFLVATRNRLHSSRYSATLKIREAYILFAERRNYAKFAIVVALHHSDTEEISSSPGLLPAGEELLSWKGNAVTDI